MNSSTQIDIPSLGTVTFVPALTVGIMASIQEYAETLEKTDHNNVLVNFILASLITDPIISPDDVAMFSAETLEAVIHTAVKIAGIQDEFGLINNDSLPIRDRFYQAYKSYEEGVVQEFSKSVESIVKSMNLNTKSIFPSVEIQEAVKRFTANALRNFIGDSIIVTGDHNYYLRDGTVVDIDVETDDVTDIPVRNTEEVFERIGSAIRTNRYQIEKNIEQARYQSNIFFWLTIIGVTGGLVLFILGIASLLKEPTTVGTISTASGFIIEIVAALFFQKDKELRQNLEWYHSHLLQSERTLTMIDIADTLSNVNEKDQLKQLIVSKSLELDTVSFSKDHLT